MILKELFAIITPNQNILVILPKNRIVYEYQGQANDIFGTDKEAWLNKPIHFISVDRYNNENVDQYHPPFNDARLRIELKAEKA